MHNSREYGSRDDFNRSSERTSDVLDKGSNQSFNSTQESSQSTKESNIGSSQKFDLNNVKGNVTTFIHQSTDAIKKVGEKIKGVFNPNDQDPQADQSGTGNWVDRGKEKLQQLGQKIQQSIGTTKADDTGLSKGQSSQGPLYRDNQGRIVQACGISKSQGITFNNRNLDLEELCGGPVHRIDENFGEEKSEHFTPNFERKDLGSNAPFGESGFSSVNVSSHFSGPLIGMGGNSRPVGSDYGTPHDRGCTDYSLDTEGLMSLGQDSHSLLNKGGDFDKGGLSDKGSLGNQNLDAGMTKKSSMNRYQGESRVNQGHGTAM
jgi:hypothetical protein